MIYINRLTTFIENIANQFPFLNLFIKPYYLSMVHDEIKLAEICSDDHVLCIGGGPLPMTALLIQKHTGANVTVLDCDLNAYHKALTLIKKRNLDQNIKVIHGCGLSASFEEFSVIHVAKQVNPKNELLSHILNQAKFDSKILVRYQKNEMCICPLKSVCQKRKWVKETCLYIKENVKDAYLY